MDKIRSFKITNRRPTPLDVRIEVDESQASWLVADPVRARVPPGDFLAVTVTASRAGETRVGRLRIVSDADVHDLEVDIPADAALSVSLGREFVKGAAGAVGWPWLAAFGGSLAGWQFGELTGFLGARAAGVHSSLATDPIAQLVKAHEDCRQGAALAGAAAAYGAAHLAGEWRLGWIALPIGLGAGLAVGALVGFLVGYF